MFSKDWTGHLTVVLGVVALTLALGAPALGGEIIEPYQMLLSDTVAPITNETATIDLSFTLIGVGVRGWSIAVCHPGEIVEPVLIEASETILTSGDKGAEPFFMASEIVAGEAFTIGVLVSTDDETGLEEGTDIEAYTITYDLLAEGDAALLFCSAGDPEVDTFFAIGGGADDDINPAVSQGRILVTAPPPPYEYTLSIPNPVQYRPADGIADFDVTASIREIEENSPGFPTATVGFTMDLAYDSDLVEANDAVPTGDLAAMRGGQGPQFIGVQLAASGTAITVNAVYDFSVEPETLTFDEETEVMEFSFSALDDVLVDDEDGETMLLFWSEEFGLPPIENEVVVPGDDDQLIEEKVIAVDGTVEFEPKFQVPFIRGDCNNDLATNIADGIYLLNARFGGGPGGVCAGACDVSGDGVEDSTDAIYLFNYQFLEGPEPPAPFPDCALGPDEDEPCGESACEEDDG